MNYADIKKFDVANGPGVRTSLFVTGCRHHCKGCFNQAALNFSYGKEFGEAQIQEILENLEPDHVSGITILGGEPFEPVNQKGILPLLKRIREVHPNKSIWCFSGFTYDYLTQRLIKESDLTLEMLSLIDVLVDGPFILELRNPSLKFKGSSNQRTIDLIKTREKGEVVILEGYE